MSTTQRTFWRGFLDCSPFILVVAPFGLLFGVAAGETGLDLIQTMSMTVLVIAGAAQFTALALLDDHTPTFIVILVSLAVNLRMAMYSAALVPHLGKASLRTRLLASYFMVDQTFAVSIRQYEHAPQWPITEKLAYYFGAAASICPFWYGFSLLGALIGKAIPHSTSPSRSVLSLWSRRCCAACPTWRPLWYRSAWPCCWPGCPITCGCWWLAWPR
jgi:predicted branched-subunit amino acid permease